MTDVTQDLKDYYKNRFHFEDVDFETPGSWGNIEPVDQLGKIILTRSGITKTVVISEILWQRGFDGIESTMAYANENWDSDPKGILNDN